MNKGDLYKKLIDKFNSFKTGLTEWSDEAEQAFAFYHGNQWCENDINHLKCNGRPYLTFNQIRPLIDAIVGSEISNKREVRYYPREPGDLKANEVVSSIAKWFRYESNAQYIDTSVFKDSLICGVGWSEVTLNYDDDPNGKPIIRTLDPLKMVWDSNAQENNLKDAKYLFYVNTYPKNELKKMFPKVDESEFRNEFWSRSIDSFNDDLTNGNEDDKHLGSIIEARYKEIVTYVRFIDPLTGQEIDLPKKEFNILNKEYKDTFDVELSGIEYDKKIVKRAFLGATKILDDVDEPLAPDDNFGWIAITANYDNINKRFYGIVRSVLDIQKCINSSISEQLSNATTQSRGGLMVEKNAVKDIRNIQEAWSDPEKIVMLEPGGLSKVQLRPTTTGSPFLNNLIAFSQAQLSLTTGISREFMGTREANQAGVLEYQRRQSSLNIIAHLFDNLKMYRKTQGEIILYLIQNFLSDGRIVRIIGNDKQEYVQLIKDNFLDKDYDVIIDDEIISLNDSDRNFQVVQQLLPLFKDYLNPELISEIVKISPLPSSFVDGIQQALQQNNQAPDPINQAMREAQVQKTQAQAQKELALASQHVLSNEEKTEKLKQQELENSANLIMEQVNEQFL